MPSVVNFSLARPIHGVCETSSLTGHLDAPRESVAGGVSVSVARACSHWTHWSPTRLKVKRAIRIDSVEPLTEDVPTHDDACGIAGDFVSQLNGHLNAVFCMYRDGMGQLRAGETSTDMLLLQVCT